MNSGCDFWLELGMGDWDWGLELGIGIGDRDWGLVVTFGCDISCDFWL